MFDDGAEGAVSALTPPVSIDAGTTAVGVSGVDPDTFGSHRPVGVFHHSTGGANKQSLSRFSSPDRS